MPDERTRRRSPLDAFVRRLMAHEHSRDRLLEVRARVEGEAHGVRTSLRYADAISETLRMKMCRDPTIVLVDGGSGVR